tara:strand:+ start:1412 stop:2350 length:939 start_codon:yes stop_codon:yes gene_type:complete
MKISKKNLNVNKKKTFKAPKRFKSIISPKKQVKHTDWEGNGLDIFLSFFVLYVKYKNVIFPFRNLTLDKEDFMWKLVIRYSCYSGNDFKITFPFEENKFFQFIKEYVDKYQTKTASILVDSKKKRNVRFIIFGLYLGDNTCDISKGHFNLAILDIKKMILERYEPYGSEFSERSFEIKFDKKLAKIFIKNGIKLKGIYTPSKFIPRQSFQYIEEYKQKSIYQKKDDPFGFCGPWCVWYCGLRLKYPDLPPNLLIKRALNILKKEKKPLRNLIRNEAQSYLDKSKELLGRSLSIKNDTYSLENNIQKLIIKYW